MAKKNRRRRSVNRKVSIAIVAGFIPGIAKTWEHMKGGWSPGTREMGRIYVGYDWWTGQFDWQNLRYGTFPIIAGGFIHKFVGVKLGVNKMLASAGIPFIKL